MSDTPPGTVHFKLPVTIHLDKYHGDTWTQTFRLRDGDIPHPLDAATVAAAARSNGVTTELDVALGDPGEVTIQPPSGGLASGQYIYDVQVTEDGTVLTWIRGNLNIRQDVTNG